LTLNYQNDLSEDTIKSDTVISLLDITQSNIQWANLWQVSDILSVNTGADWHREELGDDAISYLGSMAGEERDNVGVYLSPTVELDDLTLQASARFDKHDKYDDYFAWMLGGKYYLSDSQSVSAKYNTSFKAPDYYSLSTSPDLQPEEAKSFELAWNGNFSIANVHVTAYQSDIENLQIWYNDPSAPWGGYLENVDADIRGLELEVNFYTGPVSHQLFADLKNHEDDLGQPLARRADHSFSWKGRVNLDQFDISASLKYVGERTDLSVDPDEEQIKLDAYVIADIAGSYQINQNLSVGGRVDNLFNEQYETAGGYPAADRTYYANVNYSF
jgi:vitamin B12 transporter